MTAFAQPIELENPVVLLTAPLGEVFYRISGLSYIPVSGEMRLEAGDWVKTNRNSNVKIVFFDSQELELDQNTEIQITEALIDQHSPFLTKVKVKLTEGQVWSRVLELLHPDSSYQVEAENVVATVRGTSFNMKNSGGAVNVDVFENAVYLGDGEQQVTVNENQTASYDDVKISDEPAAKAARRQRQLIIKQIDPNQRENYWVKNNLEKNALFRQNLIDKRKKILSQVRLPGDKFYNIKLLGEKLSLLTAMNPAKRQDIKNRISLERMLEAEKLLDQNKKTEALRILDNLGPAAAAYQIQRLRAIDPDFLTKFSSDAELQDIYRAHVFGEGAVQSLLDRWQSINQRLLTAVSSQPLSDEASALINKESNQLKQEINGLTQRAKDALIDLNSFDIGATFPSQDQTDKFLADNQQSRKRIFKILEDLDALEIEREYIQRQALAMVGSPSESFAKELLERWALLQAGFSAVQKELSAVEAKISDISVNLIVPATPDSEINLLNITPD